MKKLQKWLDGAYADFDNLFRFSRNKMLSNSDFLKVNICPSSIQVNLKWDEMRHFLAIFELFEEQKGT